MSKYKHSKLKIVGCIGFLSMTILTPIAIFVFDIHGFENAVFGGACMAMFGLLIMVGILNEG